MVRTLVTAVVPRVWATGMQRVSMFNMQALDVPGSHVRDIVLQVWVPLMQSFSTSIVQRFATFVVRALPTSIVLRLSTPFVQQI